MHNQLTSLTLPNTSTLKVLYCYSNLLTSLDVSKNPSLRLLECTDNQLTVLDVSKNTALQYLYCGANQLPSLTFSPDAPLTVLACYLNQVKGQAMDDIIASLPNTEEGLFYVFDTDNITYEGNVCTTKQVAAAKAKGWTPLHKLNSEWWPYPGSEDDTAIEGLKKNPTDAPATYYDLRGYRLNQPRKGLNIIRTENGKYKKVLP